MARNLRLFYLFRLLATSYLFMPVVVSFQSGRGLSLAEIMWLNGVYCAAAIASEIPTGAIADRIGRRRSMMLGAISLAAGCAVYATAHGFLSFAAGTTLEALSLTLTSGADSAYLYDLLAGAGRRSEYPACEGTATAAHYLGNALVCVVGGLLAAEAIVLPYLVTAAVAIVAFVTAAAMREEPPPAARARPGSVESDRWRGYRAHIGGSIGTVVRRPILLFAIAYSALLFVLVRASDYLFQIYLEAPRVGFSLLGTGLVLGALYLVAAVAAHRLPALRERFGERPLLVATPLALVACYLLLSRLLGLAGLLLLAGQSVANGVFSPLTKTLTNHAIPDSSRRATILSIESMSRRLAYGLFSATILAGLLARHGLAAALLACGLCGLLGLALLAVAGLRLRAAATGELSVPVAAPFAPSPQPVRRASSAVSSR